MAEEGSTAEEDSFENVRRKVLERIKPDEKEKAHDESSVSSFLGEMKAEIENAKIDAEVMVGGSYAKGTWLSGSKDIDIFLMFNYEKYNANDISAIAQGAVEKFGAKKLHGSRLYFKVSYDSIEFEIIPVLRIDNQSMQKNIMDVSPLHVGYVKKRLDDNGRDEVRLLKEFLRAKRIYGAESHISGFSGYVCELLVIRYGSFKKLLGEASKFESEAFIDLQYYYSGIAEAKKALGKSKLSPLIIIDPVQSNRNAASAVSEAAFKKFVSLARLYSENPSERMFDKESISIEKPCIHIVLEGADEKGDKSAAMMKAVNEKLKGVLSEFGITGSDWEYDENNNRWHSYIMVRRVLLDDIKIIEGPPLSLGESVKSFKAAHDETYESSDRVYAREKRLLRRPEEIIRQAMKEEHNSSRANFISAEVMER